MHTDLFWDFLLYSLAINYSILLVWFLVFVLARDAMLALHGRWFRLAPEHFDTIHYCAMAAYKIGILLFNAVPLLALWLVQRGGG